jgi:hypothetical protein
MLKAIALGALLLALPHLAHAEDYVINDPRWLQLSDAERAGVDKQLRDGGVLAGNDKLIYRGKSGKALGEIDLPASTGLAAAADIRRGICVRVNSSKLASCRTISDATAKQACRDNETARVEKARATCG